jgi:LemA protein
MAKNVLIIVGVFAVILLCGLMLIAPQYNNLVSLDESVKQTWSQVENVYQRRADLIPNLVSTVQGAANFEKDTLQAVVDARARATQPVINVGNAPATAEQLQQFQANQDALTGALSRLLVVAENYPTLTATANFRELQSQLEGTENRISVERMRYTEAVQAYNQARRSFPTVLIAPFLGFQERPQFEAAPGADTAPSVNFNTPVPNP